MLPTFSPDQEQELRDLLILVQQQKDEAHRAHAHAEGAADEPEFDDSADYGTHEFDPFSV